MTLLEHFVIEDTQAGIGLGWQRQTIGLLLNKACVFVLVERQFWIVSDPAWRECLQWRWVGGKFDCCRWICDEVVLDELKNKMNFMGVREKSSSHDASKHSSSAAELRRWKVFFKLPPGFHCNCHKFLPFCWRTSHLELLSVRNCKGKESNFMQNNSWECEKKGRSRHSAHWRNLLTLNVIVLKRLVISTCDCGSKIFSSPACSLSRIQSWLNGKFFTRKPSIMTSNDDELGDFCMWTMWLPYAIWNACVHVDFFVELGLHAPIVA